VTGGARLIGSHLSDQLLGRGYEVRILDNLEPNTHRNGRPPRMPPEAEFLRADIRDREAVRSALEGVSVVFHQAAYGGYMPEMAKYVEVNSFGTAQMLETIRDENLPVEKVVVASSQAVYRERPLSPRRPRPARPPRARRARPIHPRREAPVGP
jgi:dTDP-L-rhamnose 4-epimerase